MSRTHILALGLLALATAPAFAADLPVKARPPMAPVETVWNWSGFYIGVNGGYGWARSEHVDVRGVTSGTFNQRGGLVGGTVGYNWQTGGAVLGLEADLDWAHINGSAVCGTLNVLSTCFTNMQAFGTVRGRLGYAAGSWMPYITGGLALADLKVGQSIPGVVGNEDWRAGWTVGAGLEWMFAPSWSMKAEYLYADFGNSAISYNGAPLTVNVSERNVNIIRGGINYHFNWGGGPVMARY
ncbi:MAG: porin family protein [Alphaproteobacteria bacterium]|nr:porin family protein [Alphaproteobacteria bacterium]